MLVYDFVAVPLPFGDAEERLLHELEGLERCADSAYRDGETLGVRIGLVVPLAKTVRLAHGAPVRATEQTTVPLTWRATGTPALFPVMEADLVLTAMGGGYSHLTFRGSYQPPFGILGRAADTVLHRLAEVTVRRFTERLAAALLSAGAPAPAIGS